MGKYVGMTVPKIRELSYVATEGMVAYNNNNMPKPIT